MTDIKTLEILKPKEAEFARDLPLDLDAQTMRAEGFFRVGRGKLNTDLWLLTQDVYHIVCGYLDVPTSPEGFLHVIVNKVFKTKGLGKTVELAKTWLPKLDVNDDEKEKLQAALEAVTKSDVAKISWSRQAMKTFYALDHAIRVTCGTENWRSKSISTLYVCDERFRNILSSILEKPQENQHQNITFDTYNKSVELIENLADDPNPMFHIFNFDFGRIFANTNPPTDLCRQRNDFG